MNIKCNNAEEILKISLEDIKAIYKDPDISDLLQDIPVKKGIGFVTGKGSSH